ncbi:MAG TPA: superoxide dismutase [Gemmataceae bacterium]|nr:superoxide dismutase [Gemmataceae bacterium]
MQSPNRRQWLRSAASGAAALTLGSLAPSRAPAADQSGFTLPKLPYSFDALEPSIDAKTMEIHHDKHHKAYVDNLNKALSKYPDLLTRPVDELMRNLKTLPVDEATRKAVQNNGGGHSNHSHFWNWMAPHAGGEPTGSLGQAIRSTFGDFAKFRDAFKDAAMKRFGSGWAWVVADGATVSIVSSPNQDTPLMEGKTPLLGIDVWEHAYYLKYQNRRADYVDAWWNVVNWKAAGERYGRGS